MELFWFNGSLSKEIYDIVVFKSGELVFSCFRINNVYIVRNEKLEILILLNDWVLRGICVIIFGDLLIIML